MRTGVTEKQLKSQLLNLYGFHRGTGTMSRLRVCCLAKAPANWKESFSRLPSGVGPERQLAS